MTAIRLSVVAPRLALLAAGALVAGWLAAGYAAPSALAGGLTLVGVAAAVRRPAVGLFALVLLGLVAPFLIVPLRLGVRPPVLDVVLVAVLAGTAVAIWRGRRVPAPRWFVAVLGAYLVLMLAATAIAWPAGAGAEATQYGLKLALASATPLAVLVWADRATLARIVPALVVGGVALQSVLAIAIHAAGAGGVTILAGLSSAGYPANSISRFLPDQTTVRAIGLLVDPNVLGVTLAAALPFVLAWTFRRGHVRVTGVVTLTALAAALALSLSRGSLLAAGAAALLWLAWSRPRLALALAVFASALLFLPMPDGPFAVIREGLVSRQASDALRLNELREAGRLIARYPWLGVGYGEAPHPDLFVGVSNAWLWIAERAGVFAAAAALLLLGGTFAMAARRARADDLSRATSAALLAVLVAGLVDQHVASFPHLVMLVGMLMALAVVADARRRDAA